MSRNTPASLSFGARFVLPANDARRAKVSSKVRYCGATLHRLSRRKAIYRGSAPANWATTPIYTFAVWRGQRLLEVNDELIIDDQSLNEQLGYGRAFNWVLWRDQPMYFFEREHFTQISYAGLILPVVYDEVAHNLCCSDAIHNITNCSEEVSFYARRGPKWYYVQLAISESPGG